jgi:hypothetical protein
VAKRVLGDLRADSTRSAIRVGQGLPVGDGAVMARSSHIAIRTDTASRIYYGRKRAQGKRHTQAVLALARRRLNVMWAMSRDHKPYQPTAPNAAAA